MEQNKDLFSLANDTVVPKAAAPRPAVKTTAKTGNGPRGASSTYSAADIEVLECVLIKQDTLRPNPFDAHIIHGLMSWMVL